MESWDKETNGEPQAQCGKRTKNCRQCKRRYTKAEYEVWTCPACGEPRACTNDPMPNGACGMHGGKSLGGIASPRAKTLEHSRYVPKRLRTAFKAANKDADILSLRFERDMIVARLDELARLMDDQAPGPTLWKQAEEAFHSFTQAQAQGSVPGMQKALGVLAEKLSVGRKDADLWKEYRTLQDQLRVLLMTELRLMQAKGHMIPLPQVESLMRRIQEIVFASIKDREVLRAIAAEFRTLQGE